MNTHSQASCGKRRFEKVLLGQGWEDVPKWDCLFVHRKQGLFLSENVDDIKMAGRSQDMSPTWKKLKPNETIIEMEETSSKNCCVVVI